MSTQTIERNYRKNPHTASFLQTFHTAIGSNGRNYREELGVDDNQAEIDLAADEDLLDSVPVTETVDLRTEPQADLMNRLVAQLQELDQTTGDKAQNYTIRMTQHGAWTPGRTGNASAWIDRMITKIRELKAAAPKTATPAVEVADGRYAVEEDGALKFFKVKNGRRAGFVFLDIQASDEWHSISNLTRIRSILGLIAVDAKAAMIRYGQELGECGHCGRTLTDEASRAAGIGPVCAGK